MNQRDTSNTVRTLNDKDQRECLKIYLDNLLAGPGRRPRPERVEWATKAVTGAFMAELCSPYYAVTIVEKNDEVAGFAILEFPVIHPYTGDYQVCIRHAHIKKEYRHSRVSTDLWKSITDYVEDTQCEYVTYMTNNPLVVKMLYKRGFKIESVSMSKKR